MAAADYIISELAKRDAEREQRGYEFLASVHGVEIGNNNGDGQVTEGLTEDEAMARSQLSRVR